MGLGPLGLQMFPSYTHAESITHTGKEHAALNILYI